MSDPILSQKVWPMKCASLYERSGKVFVQSFDETLVGTHVAQNDVTVLDEHDLEGIASALKAALSASREGVPVPPRDSQDRKSPSALFKASGVRNWREFVTGAKLLSANQNQGEIKFVPWKNMGVREHFVPLKGRDRIVTETITNRDLGAAVIASFGDAE